MLSLALSTDYPYTTSDNCTSAAAIDDVGLNWQLVGQVLMIVKAMPSRVGAGPLPHEMELIDIEKRGIEERGVVTGRPRRKADRPDLDMLKYSSMLNGPTGIILTFCDHYDPDIMAVFIDTTIQAFRWTIIVTSTTSPKITIIMTLLIIWKAVIMALTTRVIPFLLIISTHSNKIKPIFTCARIH